MKQVRLQTTLIGSTEDQRSSVKIFKSASENSIFSHIRKPDRQANQTAKPLWQMPDVACREVR